MVQLKQPNDFSTDEVGMWLVAIGLGMKVQAFKDAGVDGSMLVILSETDFAELTLSSLQGKKLLTSLESYKTMVGAGGGGGGGADPAVVQQLQAENAALRQQLAAYQKPSTKTAAPPAPAPAPAPQQQQQSRPPPKGHVVKGAAVGAAGGAVKGAVVGAMLGDAKKGAQVGAAAGATGGAMSGLAGRRAARRGLR